MPMCWPCFVNSANRKTALAVVNELAAAAVSVTQFAPSTGIQPLALLAHPFVSPAFSCAGTVRKLS